MGLAVTSAEDWLHSVDLRPAFFMPSGEEAT